MQWMTIEDDLYLSVAFAARSPATSSLAGQRHRTTSAVCGVLRFRKNAQSKDRATATRIGREDCLRYEAFVVIASGATLLGYRRSTTESRWRCAVSCCFVVMLGSQGKAAVGSNYGQYSPQSRRC